MDEPDCAGLRTLCWWRMGCCWRSVYMEDATTHSRLRAAVSEWMSLAYITLNRLLAVFICVHVFWTKLSRVDVVLVSYNGIYILNLANFCGRGLVTWENRRMKSLNHDIGYVSSHVVDSDKKWQTINTHTLRCRLRCWLRNNIKVHRVGSPLVTRQVSNLLVVHLFLTLTGERVLVRNCI